MEARSKRRKRRIRYVGRRYSIRYLLVFLALVLTGFFFLHSPYFNVSAIAVQGNSTLSRPQARALSGVVKGTNIFRVNTKEIEEKLLLNPFVASVEVERDLPNTIILELVEYEPVAVVPHTGGFMEISGDGRCLSCCNEISSLNLPVISGLGIKQKTPPGSRVKNKRLPVALKVLKLSNKNGIIAEIDVHDLSRLNAFTFSGIQILLGSQDQLEEKVNLALDIASKVPKAQYIDVRFPKSPVYK